MGLYSNIAKYCAPFLSAGNSVAKQALLMLVNKEYGGVFQKGEVLIQVFVGNNPEHIHIADTVVKGGIVVVGEINRVHVLEKGPGEGLAGRVPETVVSQNDDHSLWVVVLNDIHQFPDL